jgi:protein-S-isoprenylcysteine O-methyltransferase Ste14
MSRLGLKVPPDVVALVVAGLMRLVSAVTPSVNVPVSYRILAALVLFVAGVVLIVAARVSFAHAGTTFSPIAPARSSRLVTTGVYRFTRNPMYLGTLLALLAVAALWSNPFSLVLSAAYVAYIDRFQIAPEERVLAGRFGQAYEAYADKVRRWV